MNTPRRPPDYTQYDGLQCWHDGNGQPHSDNDQPAMTRPNGEKIYCRHGVRHRDGGPAHIHPDGREEWYQHGNKLGEAEIIDLLRRQRGYALSTPRVAFRKTTPRRP